MNALKSLSFPGILASLLFFLLPFVTSRHLFYGSVNAKYFFATIVISLLGACLAYRFFSGRSVFSLKSRPLLLLLVGALAVLYVSALVGLFPERSFFSDVLRSTGVLFLTYTALLAVFLAELLHDRDWSFLRKTIAVSSALFAFLTLLGSEGLGLTLQIPGINLDIDGLTLGNSTFAGAYLVLAFGVTAFEFLREKSLRMRVFLGVLMAVQFLSPTLFASQLWMGEVALREVLANPLALVGTARASSVAIVFFILYMAGVLLLQRFVNGIGRSRLAILWGAGWVTGLSMLIAFLFVPGSFIQEKYIEQSTAARIIVWEMGIDAFRERPLLGWGPENFRYASTQYFDNRLYQKENLGEVWFDRAHNIIVDSLVSVGVVGVLLYALLAAGYFAVIVRAVKARALSAPEGHVLGALAVAHFLQLQTSFDTVATYVLSAVLLSYALSLERQLQVPSAKLSASSQKVIGGALVLILFLGGMLTASEYGRQKALYRIFVTPDTSKQEEYITQALAQSSDFETFRMASSSLIKGLLSQVAGKEMDPAKIKASLSQLTLYEQYLRSYLAEHPEDYRVRMNFVNVLFIKTTLGGEDKLSEAKTVIASSYEFSPQNPLTYVMASLAELYSGNIAAAREKINEGIALNPDIEFTKSVAGYIEKQAVQFPNITVLKLENL